MTTAYEESTKPSRGKKDLNKIRPTSTRKRNVVPLTYREDSTTIIDDEEIKTEEESGFVLDLETHDWSTLDDDIATMIAEKVMRGRKELPAKEHQFVMTNMDYLNRPFSKKKKTPNGSIGSNKQKIVNSRTVQLGDLLNKFELANHWVRVIPSFRIRETSMDIQLAASKASFGRLTSLGIRIIDKTLKFLCPGPGYDKFRSSVFKKIENQNKTKESKKAASNPSSQHNQYERSSSEKLDSINNTLCSWSNSSIKRSIERRVL